jgi:uncharacterized membrane protein SpoIIM required for sporulation
MNKRYLLIVLLFILLFLIFLFRDNIIDIQEKRLSKKIQIELNRINYCDVNSDCNFNCKLSGPVYFFNKNENLDNINSLYRKYYNLNNFRKKPYKYHIARINCEKTKYYCQENKCIVE